MERSTLNNEELHSRFELKTVLETSRLLIESHDIDFVLNNLLLIIMGKLMITRAMVLIYQPGDNTYEVAKSKGRNCPGEGEHLRLDVPEKSKEQSVIKPDDQEIKMPELIKGDDQCTFFNLQTSNHHLGFLCLGSKGTREPLKQHEIEFVESLVIISAVAIANSRLFSELRRINRKLDRKVYELNTLFDLSKDFNMMVDREEIIRIFKFALLGQMLIRKFFFVLEYEGERKVVATSGTRGELKEEALDILYNLEESLVEVDESLKKQVPYLEKNEIKAVIGLNFQNEKVALIGVGARANQEEYTESDYNFLQSLGNLALLSVQKTYLLEERIEKERLEEEVTIARNIQQGMLPDPIPECEQLDIAATNISSYQVGGDYYDIQQTPDTNLLFAIGDVTGKGIPASLLMANLQSMLHVLLPVDITLAEATARLNDIIYENTPPDKFITFIWGKFYKDDSIFRFVNAGHNPPILFRHNREEPVSLETGGLILGAMPTTTPYEEESVEFSSGDLLVFYTDGITESMNPEETEEYGEERLERCIRTNREKSAQELMQAIVDDVNEFSRDRQYDDITLIVIKAR